MLLETNVAGPDACATDDVRLRLLAESCGIVVYLLNRDNGMLSLLGPIEALTGYSRDLSRSFSFRDWLARIDPVDQGILQGEIESAIESGRAYECGYRFQCRDGSWTEISDRGVPLPYAPGQPRTVIGTLSDASRRSPGEVKDLLHSSWERFRRVSESSPVGIVQLDLDGNCVYVNDRWHEITGVERGGAYGAAWHALAHPADAPEAARAWRHFVQAPAGEFHHDLRFVRPDGAMRWVQARHRAMRDGAGIVNGYVGTLDDITDRRASQALLEASERRFNAVFQASPVALAITSLEDGLVIDVNPASCRMFGYTRDELLRHTVARFANYSSEAERLKFIAAVRSSGRSAQAERTVRLRDGASITVLASYDTIEIDGVTRMLIALQDISERKRMEDVLRGSEERFRLLVENSSVLVAEITREGCVRYASPNHLPLLGYQPGDLVGRDIFALIHRDDLPSVQIRLQDSEGTERFRIRHHDGQWRWIESSGRVFRTSAGEVRVAVVSRDVTEEVRAEDVRRGLEAQLRQAQKLEAIGTLAGGIAHDFNNILTALFGNLQFVKRILPENHEAANHVVDALEASTRARDLVSQILTFSRRQDQQRRVAGLGRITRDALRLLRSSLPATISIQTEIDEDCPNVLCDVTQIHQVITNLGANAGHAMRDRGGVLAVKVRCTTPDAAWLARHPQVRCDHEVCVCVRDTGCGMDTATVERMFEPFFTTKAPGEGTGLGLAVVHGIVRDHGGAIVVESAPGEGTEFQLFFPAHRGEEEPVPGDPGPLATGAGQRVLLVDDETPIVRLGSAMLKTLGYEPVTFVDPLRAIEAFEASPGAFEAVISDYTMPGVDGLKLAARVRALRADIPIIIASGFAGPAEVAAVEKLGLASFMPKPFGLDAMAQRLKQLLLEQAGR